MIVLLSTVIMKSLFNPTTVKVNFVVSGGMESHSPVSFVMLRYALLISYISADEPPLSGWFIKANLLYASLT